MQRKVMLAVAEIVAAGMRGNPALVRIHTEELVEHLRDHGSPEDRPAARVIEASLEPSQATAPRVERPVDAD